MTLYGTNMHVVLLASLEFDDAVSKCEEGVVLATPDVLAWGDVRATLANDDLTGLDGLTPVDLGTESLRVRIATVAR